MGREIYGIIRNTKTKEVVWDSAEKEDMFVCGRDEATTHVASMAYRDYDDIKEDDDYYQCLIPFDGNKQGYLYDEVHDYYLRDMKEIQKAKDALEDLRIARRNVQTAEEFKNFSDMMDDTEDWIRENDWSRAGHLLEILDRMLEVYEALPDKTDLKMYLVNSE